MYDFVSNTYINQNDSSAKKKFDFIKVLKMPKLFRERKQRIDELVIKQLYVQYRKDLNDVLRSLIFNEIPEPNEFLPKKNEIAPLDKLTN